MTMFSVEFAPEAADQLEALEDYIAGQGSPETARAYVEAIMAYCENLLSFPHRGTVHDDIRAGLRVTNYKGSVVIAFAVKGETVYIIGVFYGGQDYESILSATLGH
jgi:toxin ParE1/3/4